MADGQVAGRLLVEVEATVAGFARELRRKVDEAAEGVAAKVGLDAEAAGLRERITNAVDAAAAGIVARVRLDIEAAGLRERIRTAVDAAAAGIVARVRLDIDRDHLRAAMTGAVQDAADRTQATVSAGVDRNRMLGELRQVLAEVSANPSSDLRIPADIDQGRLLEAVHRRLGDAERDVARGGGLKIPFRLPGRGALLGGILTLIQPAVGAIGQWAAGATSLLGALAPAVNTLGALPGLVSGAVAAFVGTKVVFGGVGAAVKAYQQQQQALTDGTKVTKAEQKKMASALNGVSKSTRDTISATLGLSNAWKRVKSEAQERFFAQVAKEIKPLGKTLLPLFGKQLNGVSDATGKLAKRGAEWMRTGVFRKDFGTIAGTNTKFVGSMASALGSLGHATEDWLVATAPFTQRMGRAIESGAAWVRTQVASGRESGRLNRALNDGAGVADQFGRSIKFMSVGLRGFFSAGRDSGQNLFNGLEMTMFRWDKWANSPAGQNKISKFFKQAEPGFHEFNRLVGDTVRGLAHMADDERVVGFIREIRTELGPGLGAVFNGLGRGLGTTVITTLSKLLQIVGQLAQGASALAPILSVFTGLATAVETLLEDVPGLSTTLGSLLVALLALKAARTVGAWFSGQAAGIGRFRAALNEGAVAAENNARQRGLALREVTSAQLVADQRQMASQAATRRASQMTRMALTHNQAAIRAQLAATGASEGSGLRTAAAAARQRAQASSDAARAARQEASQARATAEQSSAAARRMQVDYARSVRGINETTQATGRLSSAVTGLGARYPALAAGITRVQTAFRGSSSGAATFGSRMAGVARVAGVGLRSSLTGLTSFLGGPWGIALIAAGVALNIFAAKQRKAAQAAQEHEGRIQSLSQALIASKGLIDANVRAQALQELQGKKVGSGTDNLVTVMRKAGIGASELVDAYTGQGDSLENLQAKLRKIVADNSWSQYNVATATTLKGMLPIAKQAQTALDGLGPLKGELVASMAAYKDYAAAVDGSSISLGTYDRLRSAAENVAFANGDAEERVNALRKALDLLGGGTADYESANASLQETIQGINDGLDEARKNADVLGEKLIDSTTGGFKQSTKAGLELYHQFTQLATEGATVAQIAFENARSHMSLTDAVKAAEKAMQPSYDTARKLGKEYGIEADQVQGLAQKYGLIPSQVVTFLRSEGLDDTTAGLLMVKAQLDTFPKDKKVRVQVETLTNEAKKRLTELGLAYKFIPKTKSFEITLKDQTARSRLNSWLIAQDQVRSKTVTLGVADKLGRDQIDAFQKKVNASKGKAVLMSALTGSAERTLTALGFKVTHMKDGTVKVSLPTGNVRDAVGRIKGYLSGLDDKTVSVYLKEHVIAAKGRDSVLSGSYNADGAIRTWSGGRMAKAFKDGGIAISRAVRAFANGTENHIAQISRPGDLRVWGEPETQGEAYLPLAPAKRGRSKEILERVAEIFGGQVVYNAAGSVTASDLYRSSKSGGGVRTVASAAAPALVGGDLVIQRGPQESTSDVFGDVMFELKRIRLGGAYAGG